jgi:propanol-preferring alcohol dehydrogenase
MRALRLHEPGPLRPDRLRLDDVPEPTAGPGELVLDVSACAVCRTDVQIALGEVPAPALPLVPGHQVVGRVRAVGRDVRGWSVGERAAIGWLAGACGRCAACSSDRENLCPDARFTGLHRDGGFAEQVAVDADFALRVPDTFGDRDAAPLLCGGVIGYRSLRRSGIQAGGRLGLYGFGASASLTIQVARHWGCSVYVVTRSERDQDRARDLGAVWAGSYDEAVPVELDAAITFAPVGSAVVAALGALGRGATLAINAIHLDGIPAFPYELLWWERSIRSVANHTRADARAFLALAAEIPIRTEPEPHALEEGTAVLQRAASGDVVGAAVFEP